MYCGMRIEGEKIIWIMSPGESTASAGGRSRSRGGGRSSVSLGGGGCVDI